MAAPFLNGNSASQFQGKNHMNSAVLVPLAEPFAEILKHVYLSRTNDGSLFLSLKMYTLESERIEECIDDWNQTVFEHNHALAHGRYDQCYKLRSHFFDETGWPKSHIGLMVSQNVLIWDDPCARPNVSIIVPKTSWKKSADENIDYYDGKFSALCTIHKDDIEWVIKI